MAQLGWHDFARCGGDFAIVEPLVDNGCQKLGIGEARLFEVIGDHLCGGAQLIKVSGGEHGLVKRVLQLGALGLKAHNINTDSPDKENDQHKIDGKGYDHAIFLAGKAPQEGGKAMRL